MDCEQAKQLFDAYLDGELGSALATELGAHRVRCAECRQALALLEVSEHLITSDPEPRELGTNFTNRLLACMDLPDESWRPAVSGPSGRTAERESMISRLRRGLFWAGVSAAAAMVALAFLGAFDRRGESRVAGLTVLDSSAKSRSGSRASGSGSEVRLPSPGAGSDSPIGAEAGSVSGQSDGAVLSDPMSNGDQTVQEWVGRVRSGIQTKRRSVESLRNVLERLDQIVPGSELFGTRPTERGHHPQGIEQSNEAETPTTDDSLGEDDEAANAASGAVGSDADENDAPIHELDPSSDDDPEPADGFDSSYDDEEGDEPVHPDIP